MDSEEDDMEETRKSGVNNFGFSTRGVVLLLVVVVVVVVVVLPF